MGEHESEGVGYGTFIIYDEYASPLGFSIAAPSARLGRGFSGMQGADFRRAFTDR